MSVTLTIVNVSTKRKQRDQDIENEFKEFMYEEFARFKRLKETAPKEHKGKNPVEFRYGYLKEHFGEEKIEFIDLGMDLINGEEKTKHVHLKIGLVGELAQNAWQDQYAEHEEDLVEIAVKRNGLSLKGGSWELDSYSDGEVHDEAKLTDIDAVIVEDTVYSVYLNKFYPIFRATTNIMTANLLQ